MIDASVVVAWLFDDEEEPTSATAIERLQTEAAVAPTLWWFEVRNALIVAERRRRIESVVATRYLSLLAGLPIALDRDPIEGQVMDLARRRGLTVYDAAYLELALRLSCPLFTLDERLAAAASAEGVGPA